MSQVQTMVNDELSQLMQEAQQLVVSYNESKRKLSQNLARQQILIGGGGTASASTAIASPIASTPPPKAATGGKRGRKSSQNDKSLREVIWDILSSPGNEEGLKIADIVKKIEDEKLWVSSSGKIEQMVSAQVYKFKSENKLVRSDDKKYYIPEGVEE